MNDFHRVMNEVRANAVVFDAALQDLNASMKANHTEAREGIAALSAAVDHLSSKVNELSSTMDEVSASVGRLAGQQDRHAMTVGEKMADVILGCSAWKASLDAAAEVMEKQFN